MFFLCLNIKYNIASQVKIRFFFFKGLSQGGNASLFWKF